MPIGWDLLTSGMAASLDPSAGATKIGCNVRVSGDVSNDCVLEGETLFMGILTEGCHIMHSSKLSVGVQVHPFTTTGAACFVPMGVFLRRDPLPYCISDGEACVVD